MPQELENNLIAIIESDQFMTNILENVRDLNLNDCWIGAGFVRNKVWDVLHQKTRTELNDIDVIHFNNSDLTEQSDLLIENQLKTAVSNMNWSVKNQSRMHLKNEHQPYSNCEDAIAYWPETATAIAIRLTLENQIEYIAPYGLADLFNLVVKPTPNFNSTIYKNRINDKRWKEKWKKLDIQLANNANL